MCDSTHLLDHQTAIRSRIEHALYNGNLKWRSNHICWDKEIVKTVLPQLLTPTHALHNVRRRLVWNTEHFSLNNNVWTRCNNSTMSGGVCTHDSLLKDNHSTMSGGGCLSMDIGIESPKHRDSLGLHMNYYIHGKQYSQYAQSQWNTLCHMRGKQYVH